MESSELTYGLKVQRKVTKITDQTRIIDGIWLKPNLSNSFRLCGSDMIKGFCYFDRQGFVVINQQPQDPEKLLNVLFPYDQFRVCKLLDQQTLYIYSKSQLQPLICSFDLPEQMKAFVVELKTRKMRIV